MIIEQLKKKQKILSKFFPLITLYSFLFILLFTAHYSLVTAEIKDRVVACVENTAITLSELEELFAESLKITPGITKEEILNTIINRTLLLREAKKIRLEAPTEDELIKEYIDLKIRPFVSIKEEELLDFYQQHAENFQGKEFDAVREEIENYLTERELNQRLKMYIQQLRETVYIKIQLK